MGGGGETLDGHISATTASFLSRPGALESSRQARSNGGLTIRRAALVWELRPPEFRPEHAQTPPPRIFLPAHAAQRWAPRCTCFLHPLASIKHKRRPAQTAPQTSNLRVLQHPCRL